MCDGCESTFLSSSPILGITLCPTCATEFEEFIDSLPQDETEYDMKNDTDWPVEEWTQADSDEYFATVEHELDAPDYFDTRY